MNKKQGSFGFQLFNKWMNTKDIACLEYKDINDGHVIFERSKSERAFRSKPQPSTAFNLRINHFNCIQSHSVWPSKFKLKKQI